MKKISFVWIGLLILLGSVGSFAEEIQESGQKEETVTVVVDETSENTEEMVTDTADKSVEGRTLNLEEDVAREIMFLDEYLQKEIITNEQYVLYVEKLKNAKTTEEINEIVNELQTSNPDTGFYRWSFGERYLNLKANISGYQKQGLLSREQADKFFQDLEVARTLEDLKKISNEVNDILEVTIREASEEELFFARLGLDVLLVNQYLNQEEYDSFVEELNRARTNQDLLVLNERVDFINPDARTFMNAYVEKYSGIKANITASTDNGSITKEQATELYKQLDEARTENELESVNKELSKLLNGNVDLVTTTATKEKSTESNKSNKQENLPQTGESNSFYLKVLGVLLVAGTGVSYYLFRRQ